MTVSCQMTSDPDGPLRTYLGAIGLAGVSAAAGGIAEKVAGTWAGVLGFCAVLTFGCAFVLRRTDGDVTP